MLEVSAAQFRADEQIGRAGGIFAETDENAGVGLRAQWGWRAMRRAMKQAAGEGLVCGAVDAVGLDGLERVESLGRRDGLALDGFQVGENLLLCAGLAALDADLAQECRDGSMRWLSRGEIRSPVLLVERVGKQRGSVGLRGQIACVDQLAALGVVGGREAANRDGDDEIGETQGAVDILHDAGGEGAVEHADDGGDVGAGERRVLKLDGNDDVGVEIVAQHVGGQVVDDAAVGEVVAVGILDRRKDAGDGDGGAHGLRQWTRWRR